MSENLLSELQSPIPVLGSVENALDLVRVAQRELDVAVRGLSGSGQHFDDAWRNIVLETARGRTAEMHRLRDHFSKAVAERMQLLREIQGLADRLGQSAARAGGLAADLAALERLESGVCRRWHTCEDLEDLAARDYPLTSAELDSFGAARRADSSWFKEEGKPF